MRLPSISFKSKAIRYYASVSLVCWCLLFLFGFSDEQLSLGGLFVVGIVYQVMSAFIFFGARWAFVGFEDNPFE